MLQFPSLNTHRTFKLHGLEDIIIQQTYYYLTLHYTVVEAQSFIISDKGWVPVKVWFLSRFSPHAIKENFSSAPSPPAWDLNLHLHFNEMSLGKQIKLS